MSVVDDLRKLLQDLVTPDLRALAVRVEHLEDAITEMRGEMRAQADSLRAEVRTEIRAGVFQIAEQLRIEQRVAALEEERKQLSNKQ